MQVNRVIKTPIGVEVESSDEKGLSHGAEPPEDGEPHRLPPEMEKILSDHRSELYEGSADTGLLPCPFCGGKPIRNADPPPGYGWWTTECSDCPCLMTESDIHSAAEADAAWNRRASPIKAEVTTGEAELLREIDEWMASVGFEGVTQLLRDCRAMIKSLARERDEQADECERRAALMRSAQSNTGELLAANAEYEREVERRREHPCLEDAYDALLDENASLRAKLDERERSLQNISDALTGSPAQAASNPET